MDKPLDQMTPTFAKTPTDCCLEYEPICPWCGDTQEDAFEFPDDCSTHCQVCEKPIEVVRDISVTYTTVPAGFTDDTFSDIWVPNA